MRDSDGKTVKAGDMICFGYGIPTKRVNAPVVMENGELMAITAGNTPEKCSLKDLKEYVGQFWKLSKEEIAKLKRGSK